MSSRSETTARRLKYPAIVLDNVHYGCLLLNRNLDILYANRVALKFSKKEFGIEKLRGLSILQFAPADKLELLRLMMGAVLLGESHKTPYKMLREDGVPVYLEHHFLPARNSKGEVRGIVVVSDDVTEKRLAARSLKEAEERWRFALEGASQGVWDWDLNTNHCHFSTSYCKIYGYDPGDLTGSFDEWLERIHPEDRERMRAMAQRHISDKTRYMTSVYRIKGKDLAYRWTESRGMLLTDDQGVPYRMIGTVTDLTERKQQEEDLQRYLEEIKSANERFSIMMQATNDLIWDWNIKTNSFYRGEEGLKKVYGVESHHDIATAEKWMMRIHPEDLALVQQTIAEILQPNDRNTFELEYRFRRDDGTYSHVFDRGLILREGSGSPIRIIGAAQDISDRKRLENEILQQELEYKKTINKATIDSQEQERSEIGRELHDNVNQVLTTTKLMLEMSAQGGHKSSDELLQKCIQNISHVIDEIRQLSRSLMDPSIQDLGIIDSINDMAEAINLTNSVQVIFNYDASIEKLLNKNQKLATFRIIQESINNVIKHAGANYVIINLSHNGEEAELDIEDDGCGFDSFTIKRGAGLSNIENRVYLINGKFSITTSPGRGCRLTIKYPLKK